MEHKKKGVKDDPNCLEFPTYNLNQLQERQGSSGLNTPQAYNIRRYAIRKTIR